MLLCKLVECTSYTWNKRGVVVFDVRQGLGVKNNTTVTLHPKC